MAIKKKTILRVGQKIAPPQAGLKIEVFIDRAEWLIKHFDHPNRKLWDEKRAVWLKDYDEFVK